MSHWPLIRKNGVTVAANADDPLSGVVTSLNKQSGSKTLRLGRQGVYFLDGTYPSSSPGSVNGVVYEGQSNVDGVPGNYVGSAFIARTYINGVTQYTFLKTSFFGALDNEGAYLELMMTGSVSPTLSIGLLTQAPNYGSNAVNIETATTISCVILRQNGDIVYNNLGVISVLGNLGKPIATNSVIRIYIKEYVDDLDPTDETLRKVWLALDDGLWNGVVGDTPGGNCSVQTGFTDSNINHVHCQSFGMFSAALNYGERVLHRTDIPQACIDVPSQMTPSDSVLYNDGMVYWQEGVLKSRQDVPYLFTVPDNGTNKQVANANAVNRVDIVSGGTYTIDYTSITVPPTYVIGSSVPGAIGSITVANGQKCTTLAIGPNNIGTYPNCGDIYTLIDGVWVLTDPMLVGTRRVIYNTSGVRSSSPRSIAASAPFNIIEKPVSGNPFFINPTSSPPKASSEIGHANSANNLDKLSNVIGSMATLSTTDKTSIVNAINELDAAADDMLTAFNAILNS